MNTSSFGSDADGAVVELVDQFPGYELGGVLSHLRDVCGQDEPGDAFTQMYACWQAYQKVEDVVARAKLSFSVGAANELVQSLRVCERQIRSSADTDENKAAQPLPSWRMHGVRKLIDKFAVLWRKHSTSHTGLRHDARRTVEGKGLGQRQNGHGGRASVGMVNVLHTKQDH